MSKNDNLMKIDFVYAWCDSADPEFAKSKREQEIKLGIINKNDEKYNDKLRYQNNDELKYSLRSVMKYASWFNHIYIITNKQKPEWLVENEKLTVIDHTQIIPKEILPVFNANVIEQYLINIPGLEDKFLYLNDDVFFARKVKKSDFFSNDKPIVHMKHYNSYVDFNKEDYWKTLINNAYKLFCNKRNIHIPFYIPIHGVDAFSKSMIKKILDFYPETYENNKSVFRDEKNIGRVLWQYEMIYYNDCKFVHIPYPMNFLVKLSFIFSKNKFYTSYIDERLNIKEKIKMHLFNPVCFCINNMNKDDDIIIAKKYLEKRFTKKTEFEK